MSKTDAFENAILAYIFNNTAIPSLVGVTTLYMSLHTDDPTEPGNQTTFEATYGAYARQPVARTAAGFIVTGNSASPATTVIFPQCTSGNIEITHAGIGTDATGAGNLIYSGIITPNLQVQTGVTPRLTPDSFVTED